MAPRFPPPAGSLAAAASARVVAVSRAFGFPSAWVEVWTASGGIISQIGEELCVFSPIGLDAVTVPHDPDLSLYFNNADEQQGALNALHAILRRAGAGAVRDLLTVNVDPLEPAWDLIRQAYRDGLALDSDPIEAAHQRILAARPTTNRGAMIQLLTGLLHEHGVQSAGMDIEAAVIAEDYATLSAWEEAAHFDWGPRFFVRALCTLAAMEASHA